MEPIRTTPECCTGDEPSAFVQLRICPKQRCRKYGVAGMIALIEAGDRASDDEIIARRAQCRVCEHRTVARTETGTRHVCGLDRTALHWRTAVQSMGVRPAVEGSGDGKWCDLKAGVASERCPQGRW